MKDSFWKAADNFHSQLLHHSKTLRKTIITTTSCYLTTTLKAEGEGVMISHRSILRMRVERGGSRGRTFGSNRRPNPTKFSIPGARKFWLPLGFKEIKRDQGESGCQLARHCPLTRQQDDLKVLLSRWSTETHILLSWPGESSLKL